MNIEEKVAEGFSSVAPEAYKDLVKPAAQEIGMVAGRSAKALLSPVRAFLWGWEQIEEVVIDGVNKRIASIPEQRRKTPEPEIAVPLIQALSYTAQNETLREMYLNLLANSMDSAKNNFVHPSFVELIKQMNSLDAKVFENLSNSKGFQTVINPHVSIKNKGQNFVGSAPEWFIGWAIDSHSFFEVSSSLIRISKFGLIELMYDRTPVNISYDTLINHKYLLNVLEKFQKAFPDKDLEITHTKSVVYVNEYGQQFKKACMDE